MYKCMIRKLLASYAKDWLQTICKFFTANIPNIFHIIPSQ